MTRCVAVRSKYPWIATRARLSHARSIVTENGAGASAGSHAVRTTAFLAHPVRNLKSASNVHGPNVG